MATGLAVCFTGGLGEVASWAPLPPAVPGPGELEVVATKDPRNPSIADWLRYRPCIGPAPYSATPLKPGEPARTGGWLLCLEGGLAGRLVWPPPDRPPAFIRSRPLLVLA